MSRWILVMLAAVIVMIVIITSPHSDRVLNHVSRQALPAGSLSSSQARAHIGEKATVCGVAVSSDYGGGGRNLVNLDKSWPHTIFTISIRSEDWGKFSPPPDAWKGKQVCVSGTIEFGLGVPRILATSPAQISVK